MLEVLPLPALADLRDLAEYHGSPFRASIV
jgi:hypothetical protein